MRYFFEKLSKSSGAGGSVPRPLFYLPKYLKVQKTDVIECRI